MSFSPDQTSRGRGVSKANSESCCWVAVRVRPIGRVTGLECCRMWAKSRKGAGRSHKAVKGRWEEVVVALHTAQIKAKRVCGKEGTAQRGEGVSVGMRLVGWWRR